MTELAVGMRFNLSLTVPRELTQDRVVVIDSQIRVVRSFLAAQFAHGEEQGFD